MQTYTVFCTEHDRTGTTWIGVVQAEGVDHAWSLGRQACADDWLLDDPADVHVMGIAEGEIKIARWHD